LPGRAVEEEEEEEEELSDSILRLKGRKVQEGRKVQH